MTIPSSTEEMLASIPMAEQGGLGIIPVSTMIMPHILPLDTYRVEKGHMIFDVSFEDIHKKLLLSSEYCVEGVFFDVLRARWHILVRSEVIPAVEEGALLPTLTPKYSKDMDTGVVIMTGLEIDTGTRTLVDLDVQQAM